MGWYARVQGRFVPVEPDPNTRPHARAGAAGQAIGLTGGDLPGHLTLRVAPTGAPGPRQQAVALGLEALASASALRMALARVSAAWPMWVKALSACWPDSRRSLTR